MANIYNYKDKEPQIAKTAFVHPTAVIIGDVTIKDYANIWPNVVIRGDLQPITIGEYTNVQDNSTIHTMNDAPTHIGSFVTIGHNAIIHGSKIGDNSLIGMGAILLGYSEVGNNSVIGAGSLVTERSHLPNNSMIFGSPAKIKRALTEDEIEALRQSALHYHEIAEAYKK